MVVTLGAILTRVDWSLVPWWFVPLLLVLVRPLAASLGLAGALHSRTLTQGVLLL